MQNKILTLFVTFIVLFSLQGYSQTTKESNHPLLDKYYPRAEKDTNTTVATEAKPAPLPNQVSEIKPAIKPSAAPVVTDKIVINTTIPKPEPQLTSETIPAPVVTDTVALKIENPITPAETKLISETIPSPVVADTTATVKPMNVTVTLPVRPKTQAPAPATAPPLDMRLGSSTKAYDTWKKNNNGAGSVTTSAK